MTLWFNGRSCLIGAIMSANAIMLRWLIRLLILICTAATLIFPSAVEVLIFILHLTSRGLDKLQLRLRPDFRDLAMRSFFVQLISLRLLSVLWSNLNIALNHLMQVDITYHFLLLLMMFVLRLLIMLIYLEALMFLTCISPWCQIFVWVRLIRRSVAREYLLFILTYCPQIFHKV